MAVEAPRELRRDESFELLVPGAPGETPGYEQRLVPGRNPQSLELGHRRGDRGLTWIAIRAGERQVRRLDDDGRAGSASYEGLERLAGERETERVTDRCAHVRLPGVPRPPPPDHRIVRGGVHG